MIIESPRSRFIHAEVNQNQDGTVGVVIRHKERAAPFRWLSKSSAKFDAPFHVVLDQVANLLAQGAV